MKTKQEVSRNYHHGSYVIFSYRLVKHIFPPTSVNENKTGLAYASSHDSEQVNVSNWYESYENMFCLGIYFVLFCFI